jgi:hypothetical protein
VRPLRAQTTVTIQVDPRGRKGWRKLKTLRTTATGVYALRVTHRDGQRYRVRWGRFRGAAVRAY